jgi:LysR family transcriptional regulator, transcriptional activator for bauABCD operon
MASNRLPNITDHDILLLRVFDTVVKAGSFTAAEICLNKSKSAISVYISTLETRLGQVLCRRGRSGFSLTPEGQKIFEICQDLFADLDRFRDRVSRVTALVGGTITIAIDDNLFGCHEALASSFGRFHEICPDVFLNVWSSSPERVMQLLQERAIDIGICAIPHETPGTVTQLLWEDELGFYCGAQHPCFPMADEAITDEMLAGYGCVDLNSYQDRAVESALNDLRAVARSGQSGPRLMLIMSGKYVGFLSRSFAEPWVSQGLIREIHKDTFKNSLKFHSVVRSEFATSKVCDQMLTALKNAFAGAMKAKIKRKAHGDTVGNLVPIKQFA